MTPTEILHDALQQCIDLSNSTSYDVHFGYHPSINIYSITVFNQKTGDIDLTYPVVKINEEDHQKAMQKLNEFLERSESVATR